VTASSRETDVAKPAPLQESLVNFVDVTIPCTGPVILTYSTDTILSGGSLFGGPLSDRSVKVRLQIRCFNIVPFFPQEGECVLVRFDPPTPVTTDLTLASLSSVSGAVVEGGGVRTVVAAIPELVRGGYRFEVVVSGSPGSFIKSGTLVIQATGAP
jgi:hypothetical protein